MLSTERALGSALNTRNSYSLHAGPACRFKAEHPGESRTQVARVSAGSAADVPLLPVDSALCHPVRDHSATAPGFGKLSSWRLSGRSSIGAAALSARRALYRPIALSQLTSAPSTLAVILDLAGTECTLG